MTHKLSAIFRKSLEDYADVHSLEDEMRFIDDYLSIERVRFGDEKLKVVKEIEPGALGTEVPSMILQPIVENAIKHGISKRKGGGVLRIAARRERGGVEIRIVNNGPPGDTYELDTLFLRGTGLRNVYERLQIYACDDGELSVTPCKNDGVEVRLFVPRMDERRRAVADPCHDRR
jgi:sensor histidine kinase YesM